MPLAMLLVLLTMMMKKAVKDEVRMVNALTLLLVAPHRAVFGFRAAFTVGPQSGEKKGSERRQRQRYTAHSAAHKEKQIGNSNYKIRKSRRKKGAKIRAHCKSVTLPVGATLHSTIVLRNKLGCKCRHLSSAAPIHTSHTDTVCPVEPTHLQT